MGAVHPLLTVGIGASLGCALVNLIALVWLAVDAIAAGQEDWPVLWPAPGSLTVWTGEDLLTMTRSHGGPDRANS